MQVAGEAGQKTLAQTWLLLGASLNDLVPASESKPSEKLTSMGGSRISHPVSAPATIYPAYSFPSSLSSPVQLRKTSPNQVPGPRSSSASASRKMTPASSNASSPRQVPTPLPSLPSLTPRRPSFLNSRDYNDADFARRPSISHYRRPSVSTPGSHSISPVAERTGGGTGSGGGPAMRHVGEGALDDSDSSSLSGSAGEGGHVIPDEGPTVAAPSLVSPLLLPNRGAVAPSPLSRVAGQHRWSEDEAKVRRGMEDDAGDGEDGSSSPSPRSTETESVDSGSPPRQSKSVALSRSRSSKRRHSVRVQSRSRSSTVASLAAGPPGGGGARHPLPSSLVHQDSQSSIRTVTAGEGESSTPVAGGVKHEETLRDHRDYHQDRRKSIAVCEIHAHPLDPDGSSGRFNGVRDGDDGDSGQPPQDTDATVLTDRRIELVCADEGRFRELAWVALREALEILLYEVWGASRSRVSFQFPFQGDIQTSTILALIAPEELKITKHRVLRLLDSYIGSLPSPSTVLRQVIDSYTLQNFSADIACIPVLPTSGNTAKLQLLAMSPSYVTVTEEESFAH